MKRFNIVLALAAVIFCFAAFTVKNSTATEQQPRGNAVGLEVGNLAPELQLTSPDGKTISLYSLRGNVVLVDFWASWCGPCRGENPNVVATYNQYKSAKFKGAKGFKIYSVSLDHDQASWTAAIKHDGLIWPDHVSDLKGWQSSACGIYGINSIPTNFLLNADGVIIAKGLRGEALGEELAKLVK